LRTVGAPLRKHISDLQASGLDPHFFTDYAPAPIELALADNVGGLIRADRDLTQLHAPVEPDTPNEQVGP